MLPTRVSILPVHLAADIDDLVARGAWRWFRSLAADVGAEIGETPYIAASPRLMCAYPVDVEWPGQRLLQNRIAFDWSDFLAPIDGRFQDYTLWVKSQATAALDAHPNYRFAGVGPMAFSDWADYRERSEQAYEPRDTTLYKVYVPPDGTLADLRRRRLGVRARLEKLLGARVDTAIHADIRDYWQAALTCRVSVHVPGTWPHQLGRCQWQLMGLGVCTLSPDIWTSCCGARPEGWEHYVPLRDSYVDLEQQIEWCYANPQELVAIGRRAKAFFQAHGTPPPIWKHLYQRTRGGNHHEQCNAT